MPTRGIVGLVEKLTEDALRAGCDEGRFARGEDYIRYVHGLRIHGKRAEASIQAKQVYLVDLDWSGARVKGACTCWDETTGLCKHRVAVGLAVLGATPQPTDDEAMKLRSFVHSMSPSELADTLLALAAENELVERRLRARMASRGGDTTAAAKDLTDLVSKSLSTRGFIDYRRTFDVAAEASTLLDELEGVLGAGGADVVRPALERVLSRLRKIGQHADDSGGVIGNAESRALGLYIRACSEGTVDGPKLGRWLVKYQRESPGWPDVHLVQFADSLGDKGIATYRRELEKWSAGRPRKQPDPNRPWLGDYERVRIDNLLIELADHDGDVDRVIEILDDEQAPRPASAIRRLFAAGRDGEAMARLYRELDGDNFDQRDREQLKLGEVIEYLSTHGDSERALAYARESFERLPEAGVFRRLVSLADDDEHRDSLKEWALSIARARDVARGSANHLVGIHLAEGEPDAAWAAVHELGRSYQWQELISQTSDTHPAECAAMLTLEAEGQLTVADNAHYRRVAELLTRAKPLYAAAGRLAELDEFLRMIRTEYARRPSFIDHLDRAGLIPAGD